MYGIHNISLTDDSYEFSSGQNVIQLNETIVVEHHSRSLQCIYKVRVHKTSYYINSRGRRESES